MYVLVVLEIYSPLPAGQNETDSLTVARLNEARMLPTRQESPKQQSQLSLRQPHAKHTTHAGNVRVQAGSTTLRENAYLGIR